MEKQRKTKVSFADLGCRRGMRGRGPEGTESRQRFPKNRSKTVEIHAFLAKPATQQIEWGNLLRDLFDFCILFQPTGTWGPAKRACAKPLEKQRKRRFPRRRPKTPLMCSRLQQASLEPASHSQTATDLLGNSSETLAFVMRCDKELQVANVLASLFPKQLFV